MPEAAISEDAFEVRVLETSRTPLFEVTLAVSGDGGDILECIGQRLKRS